jgi:type IV secretion system protein TrbE
MRTLQEYRTRESSLADLLLYDSMIADGVMLMNDGGLLAAWTYRGPDMQAATHAEMAALAARLNHALKLGSGWMIHVDCIRSKAPGYPERGHFPDTTTRVIDEERRQQFTAESAHYESEYYFALTYLPPMATEEKMRGWMFEGRQQTKTDAERILDTFKQRIASFEDVFSTLFRVERLQRIDTVDEAGFPTVYDRLCRYLRRTMTGNDHPFVLPDIPSYLNHVLASQDFVGGISPRIGDKEIRVVAINGFPKTSFPGIISALDGLAIEFRWNTRAQFLDPEEAKSLLDKERKKWKAKIRGWKDQLFRTQTGPVNLDAQEMAADAETAMGVASAGDVYFALYSSNIVILEQSARKAEEHAALVVKTIRNLGFDCRVETVNAIEAWRGTLPGDGYRNVRRVVLHTLNIADLLPITSVWAGLKVNPSALMPKDSPSLFHAATTGATPYRMNLHVSDLGHAVVMGPTGAGKSTLLGLLVAQWFRYPKAQVFSFDKGYSLQMLTLAANGEFYDIGGNDGKPLSFCPLYELATASDVAWAVDYLEGLCVLQGVTVTPKQRSLMTDAVRAVAEMPKRSLTAFCATLQDEEVREALRAYTLSGAMGSLLDAEEDSLGDGRFLAFETEHLMHMGEKAIVPVLLYLFRCIERRLDGSPTLVPLDESWVFLKHPLFKERIKEWLKTLRRKNGAVVLFTQGVSDIYNSSIRDVIVESCPTKIYLPNAEAGNETVRQYYESMGLNTREISIIQTSTPKRHYYVTSPLGRRLINLGLGPVALAFVGVNGAEERAVARKVREANPSNWQAMWLRQKGVPDWAQYYEQQNRIGAFS